MSCSRIFFLLGVSVFLAGTVGAHAAGFVKSADVGGYKVVVEGGGVNERKEIQYDADGKEVFNSENNSLKGLFGSSSQLSDDTSLFGGDEGLQLENLTTLPQNTGEKSQQPAAKKAPALPSPIRPDAGKPTKAEPAQSNKPAKSRLRSPWAAPLNRKGAKKTTEKAGRAADKEQPKNRDVTSVMLDPRSSLLRQPTTEDGRKMPFYAGGGNSKEQIDPNATLKNFMKVNDRYTETREFGEIKEFETTDRYANTISMDQWHAKYSSLGGKKVDRYEGTSAFAEARFSDTQTIEKNLLENNLTWARSRESQITVSNSLAQKIIEKYATANGNKYGSMRLASPGTKTGLSMQDINRYQFRRSHSSEAGLSTVSPGGSDVTQK